MRLSTSIVATLSEKSLARNRPLPPRATLAAQARRDQAEHDAAEDNGGADDEPALSTEARERGALDRELFDLMFALDHFLAQAIVLLLDLYDVCRRRLDVRQLSAHVFVIFARVIELGLRVAELLRERSHAALELRDACARVVRRALGRRNALSGAPVRRQEPREHPALAALAVRDAHARIAVGSLLEHVDRESGVQGPYDQVLRARTATQLDRKLVGDVAGFTVRACSEQQTRHDEASSRHPNPRSQATMRPRLAHPVSVENRDFRFLSTAAHRPRARVSA